MTELNIDGYHLFTTNLENKTGRGVCIYTRTALNCTNVEFKDDFQESVWVTLETRNSGKLLIGCIYRSKSLGTDNTRKLCNLIEQVYTKHSKD